jgi:hypothetical protein
MQIGGLNIVGVEEQFGVQIRTGVTHPDQVGDTAGHHQLKGQRLFDTIDVPQLQFLHAAGVLQNETRVDLNQLQFKDGENR